MPFVTEELWTTLTGAPTARASRPGRPPTAAGRRRRRAGGRRAAAGRHRGPPVPRRPGRQAGQRVAARLAGLDAAGLAAHEPLIRSLAAARRAGRRSSPRPRSSPSAAGSPSSSTPAARSTSPPSGPGSSKDQAAAEKEAAQCRAKLDNPAFTDKAPEPVVEKIRRAARRRRGRPGPHRPAQLDALPALSGADYDQRPSAVDARPRRETAPARGASPAWCSTSAASRRCSTCSATRSGRTRRSTSPAPTARPRPPG